MNDCFPAGIREVGPPSEPRWVAGALETHASVVVFVADRAYKLKKPVDLGFLDFRTREARERCCRREVELNRRLAPDVYLGTADVTGPDGRPCDHLVVMRRMPEARRLSTLVRRGEPVEDDLRRLARLMAAFHAAAPANAAIAAEGSREALRRRWSNNLLESERFRATHLDGVVHAEIGRLARRYLDGRGPLFEWRVAAGFIRDGHGDLIADDVFCLPDGPRVLDCLEFDDRLRWLDVLDDVCFLAMDLERLGAPHLAEAFLADYAEFSGGPRCPTLEHHYIAYRAFVRAKVSCLRAEQGDPAAATDAAHYAALALRHLRAGAPTLLLVGGAPGTGKSSLAGALADRLGWTCLRTDQIRRELPSGRSPERYGATAVAETYAVLLARARLALEHGECVIVDATWRSRVRRAEAARVAAETRSDLVALECRAPAVAARAERRRLAGHDVSEAGGRVATALAAAFEPWPQARTVDTSGTPEQTVTNALHALALASWAHRQIMPAN